MNSRDQHLLNEYHRLSASLKRPPTRHELGDAMGKWYAHVAIRLHAIERRTGKLYPYTDARTLPARARGQSRPVSASPHTNDDMAAVAALMDAQEKLGRMPTTAELPGILGKNSCTRARAYLAELIAKGLLHVIPARLVCEKPSP